MATSSAPSAQRRRQRSTRLSVAVALLVLSGLLVAGMLATGSFVLAAISAVGAVVLGAAATRITHSELVQTRRDWARDRAEQAQAYRAMDARRSAEHREFVDGVNAERDRREKKVVELEVALVEAKARAADATRRLGAEAHRAEAAEAEGARLGQELEASEGRAAEAIVRVAELEQELDVLRAELEAWQSAPLRKHA